MTQDRFLKLLDNPDLLTTISYEELKTLALAYPYAHNLRYLLAIKAGQEDHPDFSRNLAAAAAYSLDRKRLFALMVPIKMIPQSVLEEAEQILELKPIAIIQRELDARAPVERSDSMEDEVLKSRAVDTEGPSESQVTEQRMPAFDLTDNGSIGATDARPVIQEKIEAVVDETSQELANDDPAEEQGFSSFSAWVTQFNPPALATNSGTSDGQAATVATRTAASDKPGSIDATAPAEPSPQTLAEKSVQENKSILSETLAKLYVQQGYLEKALDMYQRLSLAFPDKSAYFAAEIEKLKR